MLRSIVLLAALFAFPAFALDAGSMDIILDSPDAGLVVDAGVVDTAPMAPITVSLPDGGVGDLSPTTMVVTVFTAVKTGNWWVAAAAFLVLVVGVLRSMGKKFHAWLPDNNILDKPLWFLFDTKVGGWLLNWLTAIAGGVGTAMAAGIQPDFSIWKSVLMVSTTGTMLVELYKDIVEWIKTANEKKAAAKAAAVTPPPAVPPVA